MKLPKVTNPFKKKIDNVIIVSGLPRSGTSMMMQILRAGGIKIASDNVRQPDINNRKGYYELESVKSLAKGDFRCFLNSRGNAIKVVSSLLKYIPPDFNYRVILMRRNMNAVLASQNKMLQNLKQNHNAQHDVELSVLYSKHIDNLHLWLKNQKNIEVLELDYDDILNSPKQQVLGLEKFVGYSLDRTAMELTVDNNMNHHFNS